MSLDANTVVLQDLRKQLQAEDSLPDWCNGMFAHAKGIEVWIDPGYPNPPTIPSEFQGVSIVVKKKGPGQAC